MPDAGAFVYLRATSRIGLPQILLCFVLALCAWGGAAARAGAAPLPLIVDTDMFSDPDDVGALATAFGLQNLGEAKVIAVVVNRPTSRPAVATNSWKCVAAVTAFYDSASVPIGTYMPNNGSTSGDSGFATPCAARGPASPPAPDPAVDVYRDALAAQPDGSVVIVSTGFMGNLADLLDTDPGLVAQKVDRLVVMGGGYRDRAGETNLAGDPASAQEVANHWPTKIVWSGYEIGEVTDTGQTISSTHPMGSPVRAAYESGGTTSPAIKSWDLTAVYHAIRPDDDVLSEVGPGKNTVTNTGANSFTFGAGNQFYLELTDETALEDKIETLLDTVKPVTPPPPPPPSEPPTQTQTTSAPSAGTQAAPPADASAPQPVADEAAAPPLADTPAPAPGCFVPTLAGRTLAGARKLLALHRCALGKVSRPRQGKASLLRVTGQSLVPRRAHRTGTRVAIRLR